MDAQETESNIPRSVRNKVLVVGNLDCHAAVKSITKNKQSDSIDFHGGKISKFTLDNKYYTAEIDFISFGPDSILNQPSNLSEFGHMVDALIVAFDSNQVDMLSQLKQSWVCQWIDEQDPNILLAITNADVESESFSDDVREWCFEQGLELIDIRHDSTDSPVEKQVVQDDDSDDGMGFSFQDRTGFDRVLEAVEAHAWPNMTLKHQQQQQKRLTATDSDQRTVKMDTKEPEAQQRPPIKDEGLMSLLEMLNSVNLGDEGDVDEATLEKRLESFEATLQNLRSMRERAQGLPDAQRRDIAAQVAVAFANMLGDDSDEDFDDLEDIMS